MDKVVLKDKGFSVQQTQDYNLVVFLGSSNLAYLISDAESDKYMQFCYVPIKQELDFDSYCEVVTEFMSNDIFRKSFNNVKILHSTFEHLLLPEPVYNTDSIKLYYELSYKLDGDSMLITNKLQEMFLVYPLGSYLSTYITNTFGHPDIYHHSYSIIQYFIQQNRNSLDENVVVNIENGYFDVIVFRKSNLMFFNSFRFKNVNDYIYFLMNVFDQLKINPQKVKLQICGKISHESAYFYSAKTFIANVSLISPTERFDRNSCGLIDRLYFHKFSQLFLI